jgi:hypothetical protein
MNLITHHHLMRGILRLLLYASMACCLSLGTLSFFTLTSLSTDLNHSYQLTGFSHTINLLFKL